MSEGFTVNSIGFRKRVYSSGKLGFSVLDFLNITLFAISYEHSQLSFSPLSTQRPQNGKSGQPRLSQKMSCFNNSSQWQTSDTSFVMDSRGNNIRISEGSTSISSYSVKGRSPQAGGTHQDAMPKQAAPKSMTSPLLAGASSNSFSQLSLKPLLPLQSCPRPSQNQTITRVNQKPTESSKPTLEPVLLKANFRRIKQGKVWELMHEKQIMYLFWCKKFHVLDCCMEAVRVSFVHKRLQKHVQCLKGVDTLVKR